MSHTQKEAWAPNGCTSSFAEEPKCKPNIAVNRTYDRNSRSFAHIQKNYIFFSKILASSRWNLERTLNTQQITALQLLQLVEWNVIQFPDLHSGAFDLEKLNNTFWNSSDELRLRPVYLLHHLFQSILSFLKIAGCPQEARRCCSMSSGYKQNHMCLSQLFPSERLLSTFFCSLNAFVLEHPPCGGADIFSHNSFPFRSFLRFLGC